MKYRILKKTSALLVICVYLIVTTTTAIAAPATTKATILPSIMKPITHTLYESTVALFIPRIDIFTTKPAVPRIGAIHDSPRTNVKVAKVEEKIEEQENIDVVSSTQSNATDFSTTTSIENNETNTAKHTTTKPKTPTLTVPVVTQKPVSKPKPVEKSATPPIEPSKPAVPSKTEPPVSEPAEDPPIDTSIEELEDELPPVEYSDDNP